MDNHRHRGRPPKNLQEITMAEEFLPKVHVVMRYLSNMNISNPATGEVSGAEMDALLSDWVLKGYKIVYATSAGANPNGHGLIIFLQRD